MQHRVNTEEETAELAAKLGSVLSDGDIVFLYGDLGAGKTSFSRALIRALNQDYTLEVPSPTYTLVQTYDTKIGLIWHFDLYRLKNSDEIYEIGWEEALSDGIVLVEWPERLGNLAPSARLDVKLEQPEKSEDTARCITFEAATDYWQNKIEQL